MEARLSLQGAVQLLLTTTSTVHTYLQLCFPHGTRIQAGWGTLLLLAVLYRIVHCMGYSVIFNLCNDTPCCVQASKMLSVPSLPN